MVCFYEQVLPLSCILNSFKAILQGVGIYFDFLELIFVVETLVVNYMIFDNLLNVKLKYRYWAFI